MELAQVAIPKLIGGIIRHCLVPAEAVHESVSTILETIDTYISEAGGPSGYPWTSLLAMRQDVAAAYIEHRRLLHLLGDLSLLVTSKEQPSLNEQIDRAVHLLSHRYRAEPVTLDFGKISDATIGPANLALFVAYLLELHADAAPGFSPTITTRKEERVVITIRRLSLPEDIGDVQIRQWLNIQCNIQRDGDLSVIRLELDL